MADGRRDPWTDHHQNDWSDAEIAGWIAAVEHLRAHRLYGRWQVPDSVRVAWYHRQPRRWCHCTWEVA